jgi:peptidoglycan/LPS O-acetylase OafA/YrhL
MTADGPTARIPTLDGWRAVAILSVVVAHSDALFSAQGALATPFAPAALSFLRHGVDLFFAISGFLITRLLVIEVAATSTLSLKSFYLRRSFRILPLVFVYLATLQALNVLAAPVAKPWELTATLLFVRNYLTHWPGPATIHFWSLSVEEHYYLLWPPLLALLARERALRVACGLVFAVALWRVVDARYGLFHGAFGSNAPAVFRTDTCLDALLCGAIPALAWDSTRSSIERLQRLPLTALAVLALPLVSTAANYTVPGVGPTLRSMVFALLVVSTVFRPLALSSRLLDWEPLRWIGKLSYSLYVWHMLFLQVPAISFSRRANGPSQLWGYALDLSLTLLCSVATHYAVELPLQRLGRRVSAGLAKVPLPAASHPS